MDRGLTKGTSQQPDRGHCGPEIAPLVRAYWQAEHDSASRRDTQRLFAVARHSDVAPAQVLAAYVIKSAWDSKDWAFFGLGDDPDAEFVGRFWCELAGFEYERVQNIVRQEDHSAVDLDKLQRMC